MDFLSKIKGAPEDVLGTLKGWVEKEIGIAKLQIRIDLLTEANAAGAARLQDLKAELEELKNK